MILMCGNSCGGDQHVISGYGSLMGANGQFRNRGHSGVDFGGEEGRAVLAVSDGRIVAYVDAPTGVGKCLLLLHMCETCFLRRYFTSYCHLRSVVGIPGLVVTRGSRIGEVGRSGHFAMNVPHVHLTVCDFPCVAAVPDGSFSGVFDPMMFDVGCFSPSTRHPKANGKGIPIHTHPIACDGR